MVHHFQRTDVESGKPMEKMRRILQALSDLGDSNRQGSDHPSDDASRRHAVAGIERETWEAGAASKTVRTSLLWQQIDQLKRQVDGHSSVEMAS